MLNARTAVAAMLLTVPLTSPSSAANPEQHWFFLNFNSGECAPATMLKDLGSSPERAHSRLRADGIIDALRVDKDPQGNVLMVRQAWIEGGQPVTFFWFPDRFKCEAMRMTFKTRGLIPDADDLK